MNNDLISREALREDLRRFFPAEVLEGIEPKTLFAQIMHDIDNAPSVNKFIKTNIHFNEKREPELLSWLQLDIGDIYYHINTHMIGVKTGANSFYYFTDNSYHCWPKYLRESHVSNGYKNFVRCRYALEVNYDVR